MAKKLGKGLGRGLDAIFATENVELTTDSDKIVEISLEEIKKNPYQPRTYFNEEKLNELKESIEKNGLLQPIIVKKAVKGYYIIAGERRYRAFELLGKKEIPAIIKEMTDEEMMIFAVLENLQREDLSLNSISILPFLLRLCLIVTEVPSSFLRLFSCSSINISLALGFLISLGFNNFATYSSSSRTDIFLSITKAQTSSIAFFVFNESKVLA